jgi:hypothetical protein
MPRVGDDPPMDERCKQGGGPGHSAVLEIGSLLEARSIAAALCVRTLWDAPQVAIHSVSKSQRICSSTLRGMVKRVYHNNDACASGRDIPKKERALGTDGYRECKHCKRL